MAVLVGHAAGRVVSLPPSLRVHTKLPIDNDGDYLLATGSSSGSSSTSTSASTSADEEDNEVEEVPEEDFLTQTNAPSTAKSSRRRRISFFRLIPATHPLKLTWDIITLLLSLWNAYLTHVAIRDRSFAYSKTRFVTEVWFAIDILLNFVTERRVHGTTLTTFQSVSAYYLTTWFPIDVLSLLPGELLFVSPVIQQLQKRTRLQKVWNRIKSIGKWTRTLVRDPNVRHVSVLYTRRKGVRAASKMVRLLTFYIPKYFMFIRNMKAVIGFRILRQVRIIRHMLLRRDDTNGNRPLIPPVVPVTQRPDPQDQDDDELPPYDDDDDGSPY